MTFTLKINMEIVKYETYIVIKLLPIEVDYLGWGNLCSNCNKEINSPIYYIPVLNEVMDKECMENGIKVLSIFQKTNNLKLDT